MLFRTNWHPTRKEIRYFAKTLAVLTVLFGLILLVKNGAAAAWVSGIGILLAVVCHVFTLPGRWIYRVWMTVSYVLGLVISPVAIAIVFYLVLTPFGLIARLFGKDELRRKRPQTGDSYLLDAHEDTAPETFYRQF